MEGINWLKIMLEVISFIAGLILEGMSTAEAKKEASKAFGLTQEIVDEIWRKR